MKQFVYGALVATAVLGAAGFAVMKEPVAGAAKKNVPLTLSDLTLDRAVRFTFDCGGTALPTVLTAPPFQGFVITYLSARGATASGGIELSVNGSPTEFFPTVTLGAGFSAGGALLPVSNMNPPVILRPGESMQVGATGGAIPVSVTLAGYYILPGEV